MTSITHTRFASLKVGLVLSLLTLLFGFSLGGLFGAAEDWLKEGLKSNAEVVFQSKYGGDEVAMRAVVSKSWTYFKRAHLHANGLGTAALAMIILVGLLPKSSSRWSVATATALGLGSFGYSLYWLLAGIRAPGLGGTGAAKESLAWLAIPTSGLCILGLVSVIVLVVREGSSKEP